MTALTVSVDIHKRLLYAKYLLIQAKKAQSERNELSVAVSLLLMHDASELVMLAVSDHLQLAKWDRFMEFWAKVSLKLGKEPGHRTSMDRLNTARNGFKHKGILPHIRTVREFASRVDVFCEEVTKDYLDLNFSELRLTELVSDIDVRNTLNEAQDALTNGDVTRAFGKVGIAFDMLHRKMSSGIALIREPRRRDRNLHESVLETVRTLNVLMLGIDPMRYRFFVAHTPHVSRTTSGLYQCVHTHNHDLSEETFQTCLNFVVEAALTAER